MYDNLSILTDIRKIKFVKLIQCNKGATIKSTTNAYMYVFTNYKKVTLVTA